MKKIKNDYKKSIDDLLNVAVITDPRTLKPKYDPEVKKTIEKFEDSRFGIMLCYGLFSEASTMESWVMCKQPNWNWARTIDPKYKAEFNEDYDKYIKWYLDASKRIDISKFNAKEWMDIIEDSGAKYISFVSRHHDGYSLFDTKFSDFKITGSDSKVKKDMLREVFDECEKRDIGKFLYYSPANWTNENWTGPYYYDKNDKFLDHEWNAKNSDKFDPVKWEKFTKYYEDELTQLLTEYGKIDCLWLDSNWLRPENGYDLHMDTLAPKMKKMQPGMMIVDRGDHRTEDYWTPENSIITDPVTNVPWESVITLGGHWGYTTWDKPKDEHWVIDSLLNNISNGGNLHLGIGPKGDGTIPQAVTDVLRKVGQFNKLNEEGIFTTRPIAPYQNDDAYFTQNKDGKKVYAFVDNELDLFELPEELKDYKNATTVDGKKLETKGNSINIKDYKSEDFKVRMIILEK